MAHRKQVMDMPVVLWFLLTPPWAAVAAMPLTGLDVHNEDTHGVKPDVDFSAVASSTFDKPLDFLGTLKSQHGRALAQCVHAPAARTSPTSSPR